MISVRINGREVQGQSGTTILGLAQANGIYIPTLCYHSELRPIGACRICVVEVQGSRTLVASCHTPIAPGMVIETDSPKVLEARKVIVELLLASHPDSCLVCDKANMCELRKLAAELEVGLPRFRTRRHYYPLEDTNPYVTRDLTKCILCRRCVSACREIKKENVFAIAYRGFDSKIVVDQDQPLEKDVCRSCDVCISVCPVGALSKQEEVPTPRKGAVTVIRG
ncbi:2Fe-2S iron-sulfur cluster-binding protein [Chloroflexota bacterium]